nr:DNA/RNA polymerases superfamily protein [Tanacetum cinerariifolium]
DPRFTSCFWKGLQKAWGTRLKKCRVPICWDEVGERLIEVPELIEITNEKVAVAKEKLKEARSRQKSYVDKHRRDLEFQVRDRVFLKVSPFRGVKHFGIKGKLSPRFIDPFEILERIGEGKANVVADALSRKSGMIACFNFRILHDLERLDVELCVRDSNGYWASMRIESNLMLQIKKAQKDDDKLWAIVQNVEDGKHTEFSVDDDGVVWFEDRLCVPSDQALREKVMEEAHSSPFTVHPAVGDSYVDEISMDFVTGLPTTQKRHDAIWVVVDRLTKSAHFLPIRKNYSISKLVETFRQEIIRLHGTPTSIVSDRDPRFTSRFWKGLQKAWGTRLKFSTSFHPQTEGQSERTIQTLEDMLRACALEWAGNWDEYLSLVEFAYNNSWHASIKAAPFELLYGRKCRVPICWNEVSERLIEGSELIEITNEKVAVAKEKLKEARSRQK